MNEQPDVVILANGVFPTHPVPLRMLNNTSHVVCCDGAINHLAPFASNHSSLIVIGDGDSVSSEFHDRLIQIDEQEDNDLTKATRYCVQQGWRKIAYLGCTGMREDHTVGNIGLLMRYFRMMGVEGIMYTDYGFFTPACGNHTFQSKKGQQVSIFNFGCKQLTSEGLRWNSYAYDEWWQGTLNEAMGNQFSFCADSYYLVYQTYDVK